MAMAMAGGSVAQVQAHAQDDDLIVNSVRQDNPNVSQSGKARCVKALSAMEERQGVLNGKLYHMESHREDGYDIRHQDRIEITVLMTQKLQPLVETIRHAAYRGEGAACERARDQGVAIIERIYHANIVYRKIDPDKSR